jgi:STE24 endopeptidase
MPRSNKERILDDASKYSSLKYTFSILATIFQLIMLWVFLATGLSKGLALRLLKINSSDFFVVPLYLAIAGVIYYLIDFPLNFYQSFTLEHKFNLSNQKLKDWFKDQVLAGLLSYIFALILLGCFYYILRHFFKSWWLVISLFWILFSLVLTKITPILIIPLFFKYKKLQDESLKKRIMGLAEKMRIKILDCFEIDFSKKTLKANAAFTGWGSSRRVILADTLKDKYTHEEIEVIIAHEFAHYKMKHLFKSMAVNSLMIVAIFYFLYLTNDAILKVFKLSSLWDIAALPVVLIYFVILGTLMQPFENYISRRFEREADTAALKVTGNKEAFISMMEKLSSQNLADRNPHPVIKFFFFNHPPIQERIKMAKAIKIK